MTRFIMPISEAAELVLDAHERMTSGEVFVLKMPALQIGTLAETMVEEYAPTYGHSVSSIEIDIIGARPGERVHEKLISADECSAARELEDMFVLLPQIDAPGYEAVNYTNAEHVNGEYTSVDAHLLSENEIIELIGSIDGLPK
ncbi:polysaccharide biosynthesis protein CapD [Natrialba magadii ATCC 43099]|nr:polysaccharide biosynthesis protein CapD [Natrialba magadii ATCC 43099]